MTHTIVIPMADELYWETVMDLVPIADVHKGDTFEWMGAQVEVVRVASDGTWADIICRQPETGALWRKRQHLPLPVSAQPTPDGE